MKKKAEGMSLRETFAIHRRAARDMRRIAPGCFMPFILCAVVEAASPYAPAREMRDCKGRSRLSARSALQSVSRFEVSAGDPRPFAAGFPIGARSIPVGTRFCSAKSSVLYLCFRLTRERGWRQTLFRGSRTGGFCDVSYSTNAGFLRSKIRLDGKGGRGI